MSVAVVVSCRSHLPLESGCTLHMTSTRRSVAAASFSCPRELTVYPLPPTEWLCAISDEKSPIHDEGQVPRRTTRSMLCSRPHDGAVLVGRTSASDGDWYQFAVRDGDESQPWEMIGMYESRLQVDPNGVLRDPRVLRCPPDQRCAAQLKLVVENERGVPSGYVEVLRLGKLPVTRSFRDGNGTLLLQSAPPWFPAPEGAIVVQWSSDRRHSVMVLLGKEQRISVWPRHLGTRSMYIDTSTEDVPLP